MISIGMPSICISSRYFEYFSWYSFQPSDLGRVFIAAAGEADDDGVIFRFAAGEFHRAGDGVRTFEGGQDAFGAGESIEGGQGVFVEAVGVRDAARVFPIAVLGADARVVEAGGHRVDVARLAIVILHHVAEAAVQHAGLAVAERGGVVAGFRAAAAGFDADESDFFVLDERIEHAGRIAAAADAGDHRIGQAAELFARLHDRFSPMTDWKSRTIRGNGWGPTTEPRM